MKTVRIILLSQWNMENINLSVSHLASMQPKLFYHDDKCYFKGLDFCFVYLDNIISKTEKEHLFYITQVFDCFLKANIMQKNDQIQSFQIPNTLPWTPAFTRRNCPKSKKL